MLSDQQSQINLATTADADATPLVGEWEQITHPLETRDEVGFVEFNGRMWIIGSSVTPAGASGHEVFSSSDGINWVSHGPGDFEGQRGPTTVVFDGYIYLVGGAMQTDIWRTNDPASGHWEKVLDDAPWGVRHGASVVVFDDKMWLMGGMRINNPDGTPDGWPIVGEPEYDAESFNDIWMSEDGITWTQVVEHAPWGPRAHINGAAAIIDGKMYLASGGLITVQPFGGVRDHVGEPYRDVWSTEDGINWTLETDHAPWAGRTFGSLAAFQDQLVLIGGSIGTDHRFMDHDLWFSSDGGKTWTQGDFPGLPRHASGILEFNGDLYITTGLQANDMWRLNGPKRLADQAATEDSSFSLTLSQASFDDFPDNPTFEATLIDGSALPAWLTFDPATLSITGTPLNADVGTISVVVRAVGASGSGSTMFRIVISDTNDSPLAGNVEISLNPGNDYVFADRAALFEDMDAGDALQAVRIETLPDSGLLTLDGIAVHIGQVIAASDMDQLRFSLDGSPAATHASFTFTTQDRAGAFASAASEIRFNIGALAPLAVDSSVVVNEGETRHFTLGDFGFSDQNDNDSLAGIRIDELPADGALKFAGIAVMAGQIIAAADLTGLTFTPAAGASSLQQEFKFSVIDDGGLASIAPASLTVDVNRLPTVEDVTLHLRQDRLFMPTEADFGFEDADAGDQFTAVRIDSVPSIGQFLLNGVPIVEGQIIPAWKIPQIAYIPLGTSHFVHRDEFEFSVQDSRGAFSASRVFSLEVDTILYRTKYSGDQANNSLAGDDGNNELYGFDGDDLLEGGLGDDVFDGGAGIDTVSFADLDQNIGVWLGTVYGQAVGAGTKWFHNIENLVGGNGNDLFVGDAANNRLDGGAGNDQLYGEDGDDLLLSGLGDDLLEGGNGNDTVSFAGLAVDVTATLGSSAGGGAAGIKTITGVENLIGGSGNDRLTGDDGANRVEGGDGDDVLAGRLGDDLLNGGAGSDTASFEGLSQNLGVWLGTRYGQDIGVGVKWFWDVENLVGGNGDDFFIGDEANNRLEGGNGNDRLYGEGGDDVLLSGLGDDVLDGGTGNDTVSFAGLTVDVDASLISSTSSGAAGTKIIAQFENLIGGSGNDRLTGDDGANRLEGGDGDDVLAGRLGDDLLNGGAGSDTASFEGLSQNLGVWLGTRYGQDIGVGTKWFWDVENLVGGNGDDFFIGNEANNRLEGGNGNDRLYGEGGDDVLLAGLGDDFMHGGAGNDTASFAGLTVDVTASLISSTSSGAGTKVIAHFENLIGGSGNDRLTGDDGANRLEGGDGDDVLAGWLGDDLLDGGAGSDTASFEGLSQNLGVWLGTRYGQDIGVGVKWFWDVENLVGGNGDDFFIGNEANNRLNGGIGNDRLYGEDGDDVLIGGLGRDILSGGSGADVFVYTAAVESTGLAFDQLFEFDFTQDKIDLAEQVTGFAGTTNGALNLATFDADLAIGLNDALGPNQFGLFAANAGDMAGRVFGVVDVDGNGAYQSGLDYVFEFVAPVTPIDQTGLFI